MTWQAQHNTKIENASQMLKYVTFISGGIAALLPIIEHNHHLHLAVMPRHSYGFSIVLLIACLFMAFFTELNWGGGLIHNPSGRSEHGIFCYHILFLTGVIGDLSTALPVVTSSSWALQTYTALLATACLAWIAVVGMDISIEVSAKSSLS